MAKKNQFDESAFVVVPAFNEANQIESTLQDLKRYFSKIIVVDDGSSDNTYETVTQNQIVCIKHPINLGQGAALQTGITYALDYLNAEYIITFDADGQHSAESAREMLKYLIESNLEVVLGSRFIENADSVPFKKRLILKLGIVFTRFDTGLPVTDTHNGLRAMSKSFASSLKIKQAGMAHASEIISHVRNSNVSWKEFPTEIKYTEYSVKKGQSILNAVNILAEMLHR